MQTSRLLLFSMALSAFAAHAADKQVPADNSGVNERDRSGETLTPTDQSQSRSDVEFAARIRRAVIAQPDLSVSGQNIKIIAQNNRITLRGPVKDIEERTTIDKAVRQAAGTAAVDDQLELE